MGLYLGDMREGEFFMFIFYADGNDSEEKGRHQGSRKEKEGQCQPRTNVFGKMGRSSHRRGELAFGKMRDI